MTAWTMGFKIPNLTRRLFGEGAASASVIPVYSEELEKNPESAKQLACSVVTVLTIFLTGVMLLAEVLIIVYVLVFSPNEGTRLGLNLAAMMMPFMVCICLVAVLGGILNVHRHFLAPAAAPVLLNILIIISAFLAATVLKLPPEKQVYIVATGVVIAGVLQIAMQLGPLRKHGVVLRPLWQTHSPAFRRILLLMGPMVLGLTVTQINTLADDLIALAFSNDQGHPVTYSSVSYLYYAQRLYQFPLGVLGISLATAIFPELSSSAAKGEYSKMMQVVSKGLRISIFLAVPAAVGLMLVGRPIIAVLFEHGRFTAEDTVEISQTLSLYAIGLCGFFGQQILTRAFYSSQNSKVPAVTAVVAVLVNLVLNLILIWPLGTGGLAISTAVCSYLQVIILMAVLKKKHPAEITKGLRITILKTACATGAMAIAGVVVLKVLSPKPISLQFDLIRVVVLVTVCAAVYAGVSLILKSEVLKLITRPRH